MPKLNFKQIILITIFLFSSFSDVNLTHAQETGNCSIKYSPSPLIKNQPPLRLLDPDTGNRLPVNERRIFFDITVSDLNSPYQVVFHRPSVGALGQIYIDLKPNPEGKLIDNIYGLPASLLFGKTGADIFNVGTHTFDVVRKGTDGVYCRGTYTIEPEKIDPPKISIQPGSLYQDSTEKFAVRIELGDKKTSKYSVALGGSGGATSASSALLTILCGPDYKNMPADYKINKGLSSPNSDCIISPSGSDSGFENVKAEFTPSITDNVLEFKIPTDTSYLGVDQNLDEANYYITINTPELPESDGGYKENAYKQPFVIKKHVDPNKDVGPTIDPNTMDTKDSNQALVTLTLTKPKRGKYTILFLDKDIGLNPPAPEINCNPPNPCSTKFRLPNGGLAPGQQGNPYLIVVWDENGETVGQAELKITGDPLNRPKAGKLITEGLKRCQIDDKGSLIDPKEQGCSNSGGKFDPACNDGILTAIGCIHTKPVEFVKDFMKFAIGISGGLAFLIMLSGTFQIITSAGNPDTLKGGQDRLTSAVIGLMIVIFATLLLQIIGVNILGIFPA